MLSLAKSKSPVRVVSDQWVSPTSTHELSSCLAELIRTDRFGLFHLTNEGECTWCEFARTIFDLIGEMPELVSVNSEKYGARARRPSYSVLENKRAEEIGLRPLSHWKDALKAYLIQKGFSLTGSRRPDKS
jgi:dTDP-4-dehydrorhamnose reductase